MFLLSFVSFFQVLVNVFVIFGIAAVPWLLEDHGSHLYWIPVLFALVVFFPSVRAGAHQLTDIVTRRLDRAWRGRWGRETDEHNHYYEHRQGQQRQQQAGDEAGDADRWDRYYYRNTGEEGERRREHHQATDNASSSGKSGSNLVVNRWREKATSSGNQSRRQQKKKQQASPLFFRMLFSVFPFMRYWGGFLWRTSAKTKCPRREHWDSLNRRERVVANKTLNHTIELTIHVLLNFFFFFWRKTFLLLQSNDMSSSWLCACSSSEKSL